LEDALREDGEHPFDGNENQENENKELSGLLDEAEKNAKRLEGTDHEDAMDELYKETLQHAKDLMDLGYNVDMPRQRGIFEIATMMYSRAMEAKNSKRDAQLKLFKLMLDKRKLDMDEKKILNSPDGSKTTDAVIVEDRNTLIAMMRESMKPDKEK
jgi:hypothetical protein